MEKRIQISRRPRVEKVSKCHLSSSKITERRAQVIFRLRAAHDMILKKSSMDSSLNLEIVVCAIVSVVEREWQKLRASGNGRLREVSFVSLIVLGWDITASDFSGRRDVATFRR